MAQQQIGGLAALACYTVDSDYSSDEGEEDIDTKDGIVTNDVQGIVTSIVDDVVGGSDFRDISIKQEPEDHVEGWSVDRVGVRDPQEEMQEFMQLQDVKVEIESEEETDSDTDSSSSSSDSEQEVSNKEVGDKEEADGGFEGPPRTKNELLPKDLPPVEDLTVTVSENECQEAGQVSSIVDDLVVVESNPGLPAIDLDSVLFLEKGAKALGRVFDVIGPVTRPFYVIRFNSEQHAKERGVAKGLKVYYAPKSEHTSFVFLEQLMNMKISDASWCNDEEPPPQFIEYSDDEEETRAKQERKITKMVERGVDENVIMAKRARFTDRGRGRQERGRGRGGNNVNIVGRDSSAQQQQQQSQPSYCNNMYTAQTNPFYRSSRAYDPRECGGGGISWGNYNVQSQYYQYPQYTTPPPPVTQHTQYMATPPTTTHAQYNMPTTQHPALAGASWQAQYRPSGHQQQQYSNVYQQITGNIARLQQPPLPPSLSLPPPPPPPQQ